MREERPVIGYEFGSFRMLPSERLLLQDGKPVAMTPKVFDTLLVFVQNSEKLLSKDELIRIIWEGSIVEQSNLSQNIFVLRKILGENPHEHRYLVTLPTRGYLFVAKVRKLYDEHPVRSLRGSVESKTDATRSALAVLPFTLLSAHEGSAPFGEVGIADTLITKLSKLRRVVVRPTSAILKYVGSQQEPLSLGRELQVELVLEGTIQRLGERVRVNAQLIKVADGHTCWADQFNEKFSDLFAVQDYLAEHIVRALAVEFGERLARPAGVCASQLAAYGR